jgi:hypothetical protein
MILEARSRHCVTTRIFVGGTGPAFAACATVAVVPATRTLPLRLAAVPFTPIV